MQTQIVIIGGGPAGLTAGYLLSKAKLPVIILEADPLYVGGIARTINYKGYGIDIGGHRFFSKSAEVEQLWSEILPEDLLERPRSSRIFYQQKFFAYPLKPWDALSKLGIFESLLCVLSYIKSALFPIKNPRNFAEWISNYFGKRLFTIFFKTYTEKVWGMPCEAISADWAAQRVKGLSLFSAITNALFHKKTNSIKTLINTFRYPRKGPGMLWDACAKKIVALGGKICLGSKVYRCEYGHDQRWLIRFRDQQGNEHQLFASHVISSAPLRELISDYLSPTLPETIHKAAQALKYRDFLIVALILKDKKQFADNWIYIHDNQVAVARIQNFKSWSADMVPNQDTCCYGMEYFCFDGDALWTMDDQTLLQKAKQELIQLGLALADDMIDGCVIRQPKAYPVYDNHYQHHVTLIQNELAKRFPTLHVVGRNGMHKYNNQDHAMMTAMLTVKNIIAGERKYNVWCVNQDAEYIESHHTTDQKIKFGLRDVPQSINSTIKD